MKLLKYILLLLIFISCKHEKKHTPAKKLNYETIQTIIKEGEVKSIQLPCNLKSIKEQILANQYLGVVSIPLNEKIIRHCFASINPSEKEKVFTLFIDNFNLAVNEFNENFEENYAKLLEKINNDAKDAEVRDFNKCLNICGLSLLSTEGMFYVDAKYDYSYNLFKKEAAPDLREYLSIRSDELRQGFSDDAALMISFGEVYQRVINWEDFMLKYSDFFMKDHAKNYYEGYLSTLISGMDNSRIFDYEDDKLLPEIKTLYERIIANNEDRKSTRIIAAYYEYLKSIEFKYNESIEKFLKDNELFTMLGVQPDTR